MPKKKNIDKHKQSPFFKDHIELNHQIYEVTKQKSKIVHDLPIQLGLAVYSYAKLRMLQFWRFLATYLDRNLYTLMEMDTDSIYLALARDSIDECVKSGLEEEWNVKKLEWFSSEDTQELVEFRGEHITRKQHDKRTPGKFKEEYHGDGMLCANSKTYIGWSRHDERPDVIFDIKLSSKGSQQKRNFLTPEDFKNTILQQEPTYVENAGFIRNSDGVINTYTQQKKGISCTYFKRKVLPDFVTTTHLDI